MALLAAGAVAILAGARRYPRRRRAARTATRGYAAWAVVGVAAAAWQVAAYLHQSRADHPTLSSLANALLDTQPARAAAFVVWLLVTVQIARR